MLTAQGAYWLTKENFVRQEKKCREEIDAAIAEAADQGKFKTWYEGCISASIVKELRKNGFKVKIIEKDRDRKGKIFPHWIRIEWR